MGIFTYRPSIVEPLDDGRLRFTPEPPDPRWMRWLEAAAWPLIIVMFGLSWLDGDAPGTLLIVATVFLALSLVFVLSAKIARWRSDEVRVDPPTEPMTLDAGLIAELRELATRDEEGEAIRLLRERLGIGFTDGVRIVKAVRES